MNDKVFAIHTKLAPYPPVQLVYILYRRLIEQGPVAMFLWIKDKFDRRIGGCSAPGQSKIIPGLYVGGQHNSRGLKVMRRRGIGAVVNMREESDDAERDALLDAYCWLPTTDDTAPTIEQLQKGVDFITEQIDKGVGVYIHCASGVGRAPTMAAAYLISTGYSVEQAWETIGKSRSFVRPTPPQIDIINEYAARVQGEAAQSMAMSAPVPVAVADESDDLVQRAVEYIAEDVRITQDLTDGDAVLLMEWAQTQVRTLVQRTKVEAAQDNWDSISERVSALKRRMLTYARESAVAENPHQTLSTRLSADHFAEEDETPTPV